MTTVIVNGHFSLCLQPRGLWATMTGVAVELENEAMKASAKPNKR